MKKLTKNKIAKGIAGLAAIVVLLASILAGSFYYENNITANAVKEASTNFNNDISIKGTDVRNLNQLNEGWYKTINGNLFYLEEFDKPVFIYTRIASSEHQNEMFSVDADGNVKFYGNDNLNSENNKLKSASVNNQISGIAVGMGSVSGMQTAQTNSYSSVLQLHMDNGVVGGNTRFNFRFNQNKQEVEIQEAGQSNWQLASTYASNNQFDSRNGLFIDLATKRDAQSMTGALYEEVKSGRDYSLSLYDSQGNRKMIYYPNAPDGVGKTTPVNDFVNSPYLLNPSYTSPTPATSQPAPPPAANLVSAAPASLPIEIGPNPPPQILEAFTDPTLYVEAKDGNYYEVYRDRGKYYYQGTNIYVDSRYLILFASPTRQGLTIQEPGSVPVALSAQGAPQPNPVTPGIPATIAPTATQQQQTYINTVRTAAQQLDINQNDAQALLQAENPQLNPAASTDSSTGLMQIRNDEQKYQDRNQRIFNQLQQQGLISKAATYDINDPVINAYIGLSIYKEGYTYLSSHNIPVNQANLYAYYNGGSDAVSPSTVQGCAGQLAYQCGLNSGFTQTREGAARMNVYLNQLSGTATSTPPLPAGFTYSGASSSTNNFPALPFDPKNMNYPVGTPFQTADGIYAKNSQGAFIKLVNNNWDKVNFNWDVTIKNDGGQPETITVPAQTAGDARAQAAGLNILSVKQSSGNTQTSTLGQWEPGPNFGDKQTIIKGNQRLLVPPDTDPEIYAQEWNDKSTIQKEYDSWRKSQNLPDTAENRILFNKYPPDNVNRKLIVETLGLTPAQVSGQPQQKLQYTVMQLPNRMWRYSYGGVDYDTPENAVPPTLQSVLDFKKNHPTAVLQNDKTTINNGKLFLENGKYIDQIGQQINSYISKEKIGDIGYSITYEYKDGKSSAKSIATTDGAPVPITNTQLSIFRQSVKKGDAVAFNNGEITITSSAPPTTKGVENADSYRKTTTNSVTNIKPDGSAQTERNIRTEDKDGNTLALKTITQASAYDSKTGLFDSLGTERVYSLARESSTIDLATSDYDETTTDASGKPIGLSARRNNQVSTAYVDASGNVVGTGAAKDMLSTQLSQYKSRQFFSGFQFIFTEFRGLGYIPSIFGFDDDKLIEWRNGVDKTFQTLYLGTEYWQSKICTATSGLATDNEGIAYAETPQGLAQIGAHIEATRTQPITNEAGNTTYIYKITFQVRNGDYEKDQRAPENMSINVFIIPKSKEIGDGIKIFKKNINIGRGSAFGRFGTNAIVQESKAAYDRICIKFDKVPLKWKISDNILCNKIDASLIPPTAIQQRTTAQQGPDANLNSF